MQQLISTGSCIWIFFSVDTCWVRRLQNLSNLTRLTHRFRIFLLYLSVLDSNRKRFTNFWAWFKICKKMHLDRSNQFFESVEPGSFWILLSVAWLFLNLDLNQFKQCLTLVLRHEYLKLDMFLYSVCLLT